MLLRSHSNLNSWLLKYYCQYSVYPFATTFVEELIQQNWVPLKNDYDLLRYYNSKLDIMDISYVYGGQIYHTRYDRANVIPKATIQRTTVNLLALIEAIANAPEMVETPVRITDIMEVFLIYRCFIFSPRIMTTISTFFSISLAGL